MIKQSTIFFSFLLSSITLPAAANPGWFGTIGVGLNSPGDIDASTNYFGTKYLGTEKLDGGFSGEIGFGYDFGNNWKTFLSYSTHNFEYKEGEINGTKYVITGAAATGNILSLNTIKIFGESKIKPYFGGGIGFGSSEVSAATITIGGTTLTVDGGTTDNIFVYNLRGGAEYPIGKKSDIFAEVTMFGYGERSKDSVDYEGNQVYTFLVGTKFKF